MPFPNFGKKYLETSLIDPKVHTSWERYLGEKPENPPKKFIFVYYPYVLEYFKRKYKPTKIELYHHLTLYQIGDLAVVQNKGVGAPHAAMLFEELIALGGKKFINMGSAGGLDGFGVFLCDRALRDEGTSYHYFAAEKYAYPDNALTKSFEKALRISNLDFVRGDSWTIDAPYRETVAEIKRYRGQGIKTVEMEASALFTVAKIRKVKIASAFVVSDLLSDDRWDPQFDAKHVRQKMKKLLDAAIDCLTK